MGWSARLGMALACLIPPVMLASHPAIAAGPLLLTARVPGHLVGAQTFTLRIHLQRRGPPMKHLILRLDFPGFEVPSQSTPSSDQTLPPVCGSYQPVELYRTFTSEAWNLGPFACSAGTASLLLAAVLPGRRALQMTALQSTTYPLVSRVAPSVHGAS